MVKYELSKTRTNAGSGSGSGYDGMFTYGDTYRGSVNVNWDTRHTAYTKYAHQHVKGTGTGTGGRHTLEFNDKPITIGRYRPSLKLSGIDVYFLKRSKCGSGTSGGDDDTYPFLVVFNDPGRGGGSKGGKDGKRAYYGDPLASRDLTGPDYFSNWKKLRVRGDQGIEERLQQKLSKINELYCKLDLISNPAGGTWVRKFMEARTPDKEEEVKTRAQDMNRGRSDPGLEDRSPASDHDDGEEEEDEDEEEEEEEEASTRPDVPRETGVPEVKREEVPGVLEEVLPVPEVPEEVEVIGEVVKVPVTVPVPEVRLPVPGPVPVPEVTGEEVPVREVRLPLPSVTGAPVPAVSVPVPPIPVPPMPVTAIQVPAVSVPVAPMPVTAMTPPGVTGLVPPIPVPPMPVTGVTGVPVPEVRLPVPGVSGVPVPGVSVPVPVPVPDVTEEVVLMTVPDMPGTVPDMPGTVPAVTVPVPVPGPIGSSVGGLKGSEGTESEPGSSGEAGHPSSTIVEGSLIALNSFSGGFPSHVTSRLLVETSDKTSEQYPGQKPVLEVTEAVPAVSALEEEDEGSPEAEPGSQEAPSPTEATEEAAEEMPVPLPIIGGSRKTDMPGLESWLIPAVQLVSWLGGGVKSLLTGSGSTASTTTSSNSSDTDDSSRPNAENPVDGGGNGGSPVVNGLPDPGTPAITSETTNGRDNSRDDTISSTGTSSTVSINGRETGSSSGEGNNGAGSPPAPPGSCPATGRRFRRAAVDTGCNTGTGGVSPGSPGKDGETPIESQTPVIIGSAVGVTVVLAAVSTGGYLWHTLGTMTVRDMMAYF